MNPRELGTGNSECGAEDDPRLLRAAQEYLAEVEAGRRPQRAEFVARFPEIADALAPYLDAIDMVQRGTRNAELGAAVPHSAFRVPSSAEPLGDFRIVREIGRGGMGIIYEAVQLSLGRRVALKVLSFAAALDAKQLQRFKSEAEAAAQLHHTNIVPVYAVGSDRGVHYYAMQLIEGQNLSELIRQMRATADDKVTRRQGDKVKEATPSSTLSPCHLVTLSPCHGAAGAELSTQHATRSTGFYRTAARLIVQAAEALEHAHQLGVIHRDVKPANLLIDTRGHIWITDFGLAQFHTSLALTRTGDLLGTLRYMSPEQAGGQRLPVDARTDVYSLGATFYELLTLEPLFGGGDQRQLLRQILDDDPQPPRSVDPSLPTELETIVLKAVNKNPVDRYATAQEFADDLRRFLDNRPILARRPTVVERLRKWARRHPSVVAASVVVLVLWSAGSLVGSVLVHNEQAKAERAYQRERQRAEEAETRLRLARRSVDELFQVSEEELADKGGMERLRKRVLDSVLVYYRELMEQRADDPLAQEELRETKARVEKIIADLAVLQGAEHLHLLGQPDVLADLRLDEEQRSKVKELLAQIKQQRDEAFAERGRVSPDERRQRSIDRAIVNDTAVHGILSAEQLRRLPQIALQLRGIGAFREADVAAALKLTSEQRERVRKIDDEVFWASHMEPKRPPGPPGRPPPEDRKANEQKRKQEEANEQKRKQEAMERILTLLTPEQAQRWQEMTGEPFKGKARPF